MLKNNKKEIVRKCLRNQQKALKGNHTLVPNARFAMKIYDFILKYFGDTKAYQNYFGHIAFALTVNIFKHRIT